MEYKKDTYERKIWLPKALIDKAFHQRWEGSLAYFAILKETHKKPIFYNYSARKISKILNCSPTTASFHINFLKEKGLVTENNGNLILKGSSSLKEEYGSYLVAVKIADNKKDLITNLIYTVQKGSCHKQIRTFSIKNDLIQLHKGAKKFDHNKTKKLVKLGNKLYPNLVESALNDSIVLSNAKFGANVYRSKYTGYRIQKRLNSAGFIQSTRNFEFYSKERFSKRAYYAYCEANELGSKFIHSKKGYIYRSLPNKISLLCN